MAIKSLDLFCLGASHKSAPIDFREELYLDEEQLLKGLPPVKNKFNFSELAALSTCNRFEMFGVCPIGNDNQQGSSMPTWNYKTSQKTVAV
ncbi:MAG: hypothetical protein R3B45_13830 [Bdellovibrionota bacterium]